MDGSSWNGTSGGLGSDEQGYEGTGGGLSGYLEGRSQHFKTFMPQACRQGHPLIESRVQWNDQYVMCQSVSKMSISPNFSCIDDVFVINTLHVCDVLCIKKCIFCLSVTAWAVVVRGQRWVPRLPRHGVVCWRWMISSCCRLKCLVVTDNRQYF